MNLPGKSTRIALGWAICCLLFTPPAALGQSPLFQPAKWIAERHSGDRDPHAAGVFRKVFISGKKLESATLALTARGLYQVDINGKRVGDACFTPGWTSYDRRLQYQTYDVKDVLRKGQNEITVTMAGGWYSGVFGARMESGNYGNRPALLFQVEMAYKDGSKQSIVSDSTWQGGTGPVVSTGFYEGEVQDTRLQPAGWQPVTVLDLPKEQVVPSIAPPVRPQQRFAPRRIFTAPGGERIVDFGQNLAGFVQLRVKGKRGDTVRVHHAEILEEAGNFYTGNLRQAAAVDTYILNGKEQVLGPRFTYHGFRYAWVEGMEATRANCTAIALYSDLELAGTFECSDPMINQLQSNILWSMNSNFVDIPTDCPQRSERLGWTGDAQVFCRTAAFNRDVLAFYARWLADLSADQGANGAVPSIIPDLYGHRGPGPKRGVAGWGDAATIVPWTLYEMYGDTAILKEQYPSMKAWVDYITRESPNGLWKASGYGDWYTPGDSTSLPFIDQCYWAYSTSLLAKTARVLGRPRDAMRYDSLLGRIKAAFVQAYGGMDAPATSTQTAYVLALAFDMLPAGQRLEIAAKLAADITGNGDKLATGFLGTPYLLPVLSRFGYTGLAYRLLLQTQCPSWLYPVTRGATTMWEKWDAIRPDGTIQPVSFNHFAYGAVGQWLYGHVAGIRPASPGFEKISIAPELGGGLTWARASYRCPYGRIVSSWKVRNGIVKMLVEIPPGTTATVRIPGGSTVTVGPGRHTFKGRPLTEEISCSPRPVEASSPISPPRGDLDDGYNAGGCPAACFDTVHSR